MTAEAYTYIAANNWELREYFGYEDTQDFLADWNCLTTTEKVEMRHEVGVALHYG